MRGSPPSFDIVIPTVGRPSLQVLLAALEASDGPLPQRVLLVDDRPRRPAPLVDLAPLPRLAERIEVVEGRAAGPAAARNTGWRRATAEWIAFLDDDVVPSASWLRDLAHDLLACPAEATATQGQVRVPLPTDRRLTDWERNVSGLDRALWITADMAVRRRALAAVGGFDERFPRAYREDSDLALRLLAAGGEIEQGHREVAHPVRPAPWWISLRLQAGNRDDVLIAALHDRETRAKVVWTGRRPRHLAITLCALAAGAGIAARSPVVAGVAGAGWLLGTGELAWSRIAPGPRTPREVAAMVVTSLALPPLATYHWLAGLAARRRLLADTTRAPRPEPAREEVPS